MLRNKYSKSSSYAVICSLETTTFLYSTSLSISAFLQHNLLIRKACNPVEPFGECINGETNAQHVVSVMQSWKAFLQYIIPVFLIILAGPWSDSHGNRRRPLMILPIVGQILTDALCIVNAYFWSWPPQVAAVFEGIVPGMFGARSMFWVGVISYISDNTSLEERTLRFGVINATYYISSLIGTGLSGILNIKLGFYGAFAVPISLNFIAVFLIFYFIKDTSVPYDESQKWLRPNHILQGFLSLFKGEVKNYALTLIVLLACQSVLSGRIAAEYSVMYLFVRYKFNWKEINYSYFAAFKMTMIFFGTLFSVSVLSHRFKINDAIIGVIACLFDIIAAMSYCFANEPWQMYIIPIIDMFHGTALTITTSLTSKMVKREEFGRLNSIQGLVNTGESFILVSLYSTVYNFTFEYITGAVFLMNVILTLPLLFIFLTLFYKCKHIWSEEKNIANT
ncbi:proton-coupled folate transporter-like isoform X1 [Daktulosphaira vitifoliae]|uniref:proton-coupled folate transporter-like isoform X1 n=1 Tax=Daktulosphaira vitifoliae TaxID=58002 RepID=UPI0021AB0A52|nr:proton-coupled folate transporter-like isoform X1 [Daktulosphaira vitifoliae]